MSIAKLKPLRVFISLAFFLAITIFFLDIRREISHEIFDFFLYLQFIPSLLDFIAAPAALALGFAIFLILTAFFGRIYCSSVCPLGTLQDAVTRIANRFRKRKKLKSFKFVYYKPNNILRYCVLAAVVGIFVFGSAFGIIALDPYSVFGRFLSDAARPLLALLNNFLSRSLESFDIYYFYQIDLKALSMGATVFSIAFIAGVVVMSAGWGRLYCNTICPVGALLGLAAKFSVFKLAVADEKCNGCGLCERTCKANCIKSEDKYIDFSRCVMCLNCFASCPDNAFEFRFKARKLEKSAPPQPDFARRDLLAKSVALTLPLLAASCSSGGKKTAAGEVPVVPPGAGSLERYSLQCTACHLCVAACPSKVLHPTFFNAGRLGFMQPEMNYDASYCNFDCVICSQVCPSGAILPIDVERKKTLQLGVVKLVEDDCVVFADGTDCGSCAEHCPTKAVRMIPYKDISAPTTNPEICVGCGACQYACPTDPKAIFVIANPIHKTAKKPEIKELDETFNPEEEFPF